MNREEQRRATEIDLEEYKVGIMDERSPRYRLNRYIQCFPADDWLQSMIHEYNQIRRTHSNDKAKLGGEDE